MSYQPTAEGRLGNCNSALDNRVRKVKRALDEGSREQVLSSFRDYELIEGIVKLEGEAGRFSAHFTRQQIYDLMRAKGFDVNSLID